MYDEYGKFFERKGNKFKYLGSPMIAKNFTNGTDPNALDKGKVSVTPISLDLIPEKSRNNLEKAIKQEW